MRKRLSYFSLSCLILCLLLTASLCAQTTQNVKGLITRLQNQVLKVENIVWTEQLVNELAVYKPTSGEESHLSQLLAEAIIKLERENGRLDFLLNALKLRQKEYFPQWLIRDDRLQIEVLRALNFPDSLFPEVLDKRKYSVAVIQSPVGSGDLLEILVGSNDVRIVDVEGTGTLKNILGDALYRKLQKREYAYQTGTTVLTQRLTNYASINISMLAAEALIRNDSVDIGIKVELGRDFVGYPFYYGGSWNIIGVYRPDPSQIYELGVLIPFQPGQTQANLIGPLSFKQRKLNGAPGIIGRYEKQILPNGSIGGAFSIASLSRRGNNALLDENGDLIENDTTRSFFYIAGNFHLYYSMDLSSVGLEGLRVYAGFGYSQMRDARLENDFNTVETVDKPDRFDFYGKVSYDHKVGTEYGIALQYYDLSLLASAYLKVFEWMSVEAKYARVIFRDPRLWEHRDYLALSPRIAFTFSF